MPHSTDPIPEADLRPVHEQRSFASLRSIGALILREMSTTNGRSANGYLWAVAEPAGGIILLTIIFSLGFRSPPIGTNFAIFYATGLVPFMFYMALAAKVAASIQYSKSLLAYPAVTFMDALLARLVFNTVTQILVSYIVFAGVYFTMETRTDPQIVEIALSLSMAFVIAAGIGVMNCFLFEAFPWWRFAWSILTRPLFLASCIFFIFDDIPEPFQDYLWFNPLVHVIGQMRKAFYPSYMGDYVSPVYVFGVGLALTAFGLALLVRYHRDLLNS
ncbi:ABC transporter permease [Paracoccus methylarcula]|uniref:Sugar ABC transporter permease n=1 Tax=Paracoccus methylarcula TaxID=72022 RepID=A0A422QSE1_9RHOB|nr:ABC transporter permease [Paracoccus methylarcula]RNF32885.1 sugar ABC transporter permease [Paracoccus methylarcula]